MSWSKLKQSEVSNINEVLKETDASFFQYPYYAEGYKHMPLSSPVYIQYVKNSNLIAFCSIMEMGFWPFKIGLIIRGPVIIVPQENGLTELLEGLQAFAKKQGYMFIRINPSNYNDADNLDKIGSFIKEDYFPFYKGSQSKNFNVEYHSEETLSGSFNQMCRRKIKHAEAESFVYKHVETDDELKQVYELFTKVGGRKGFKYRSYKSYKEIYTNGKEHNLCSVYIALLNSKIVAAGFIVKDKNYYNYMSGGLIVEGYDSKNSPSAKLHYLAMLDCFYKEEKKYYNISYSGPDSDVYKFKSSFNPVVEDMPGYYTYISGKKRTFLFRFFSAKNVKKIRNLLRSFSK